MILRIFCLVFTVLIIYLSMFLASMSYGLRVVYFWNLESLIVVLFPSYLLSVYVNGKFSLDSKGLKFFKKIIMPISWLGFLIGIISIGFGMSSINGEFNLIIFLQSLSIASITLLYGLILKIIIHTLLESK
tara:strand:+ start:2131 stop:2523 length:393 start_codon:yes stop_codon:yes gene_type:complete